MINTDIAQNKKISDQLGLSVTQGILQIFGKDNSVVRIRESQVETDKLNPSGHRITVRMSIEVYPKATAPNPGS